MTRFRVFLAALLMVSLVATAMAQEEKKPKQQAKKPAQAQQPAAIKNITDKLAGLDLTAEQSEKIKQLTAKVSEQLAAINKERTAILGPGGNKKLADARKEAQASGKKGKELQEAIYTAAGLSAEQAAKLRDLQAKQQQVVQEFRKAVSEILTPEQREKAGLTAPARGQKKAKKDA
ncbi:MAG: hypothetical protein KatS3mg110_1874 [Pirellulaceae bacterium]|nr:MAG: hypothetical protein KatS3mg110_1874 [Pirellulaceae bacterium]